MVAYSGCLSFVFFHVVTCSPAEQPLSLSAHSVRETHVNPPHRNSRHA
jgi:hypothetical protein